MAVSSLAVTRSYDSPQSIVCLVLFLCAAFVTIHPFAIPIRVPRFVFALLYHLRLRNDKEPRERRICHLHIDLNSGPVLAVLVLLASQCIGTVEFRAGVVGVGDVHPYDILLLFISLAYIAISLDATGALRFLAFWVAKRGGTSGRKLYFFLYLFFIVLGGLVGNDPVILSGTAFLAYFTKASGIGAPTAWIFAQFTAANLTSMVFVSSNPTNLVISSASQINFIYFSGWTIMPAVLSSCALFPILMLQFFPRRWSRDFVPRALKPPEVHPRGELHNPRGAVFGGVLLAITLATLIIANVLVHGLYVWWVTVPAALSAFIRDLLHDYRHAHETQQTSQHLQQQEPLHDIRSEASHHQPVSEIESNTEPLGTSVSAPGLPNDNGISAGGKPMQKEVLPRRASKRRWSLPSITGYLGTRFPTVCRIAIRMPWALLPFAFSFFILVDSLSSSGWIAIWAGWLSSVVGNHDATAIFFTGFICILLCNISTNIGATLILTNMIYDENFTTTNQSPRVRYGALFAIAICSNIGAYSFVFPASLAGLLWRGILKQMDIEVRGVDFVKYNILPLVLTATVALAVLLAEVRIVFPN